MMQVLENVIYTPREVARLMKLSSITIERKIRSGELKALKIGKNYRFLGRDILSLFSWERRFDQVVERVRQDIRRRGVSLEEVEKVIQKVRSAHKKESVIA